MQRMMRCDITTTGHMIRMILMMMEAEMIDQPLNITTTITIIIITISIIISRTRRQTDIMM
jgi:hypothetical protein